MASMDSYELDAQRQDMAVAIATSVSFGMDLFPHLVIFQISDPLPLQVHTFRLYPSVYTAFGQDSTNFACEIPLTICFRQRSKQVKARAHWLHIAIIVVTAVMTLVYTVGIWTQKLSGMSSATYNMTNALIYLGGNGTFVGLGIIVRSSLSSTMFIASDSYTHSTVCRLRYSRCVESCGIIR